jgi:hypothetical protein
LPPSTREKVKMRPSLALFGVVIALTGTALAQGPKASFRTADMSEQCLTCEANYGVCEATDPGDCRQKLAECRVENHCLENNKEKKR